jgi:flagellar motor switch protein FliN/FliY
MSSSTKNGAAGATQNVELPDLAAREGSGPTLLRSGNELLDSIAVEVSVVVGQAHTTVGHLMGLKESDILRIDRGVDQPIDIVVNGIVVARGQLIVIDDNFGVRVTEVAAAIQA